MKLCRDCKNFVAKDDYRENRCHRPKFKETNPVTGEVTLTNDDGWLSNCRLSREDGWFDARFMGSCGKEGRFWEAK